MFSSALDLLCVRLLYVGTRIPEFLLEIEDPNADFSGKGCGYCGGLGHGIASCPKRLDTERKQLADQRASREHVSSCLL